MKFILSLPPPLNQTYGVSNRTSKSKFYKRGIVRDWERTAGWEVKHQWIGRKEPLVGNLEVSLFLFLTRDRDIDSSIKVVLDLLQHMRVYNNDKQIIKLVVEKKQDLKNSRLEVEIKKVL